mgnify:FL=1
MSRALFAFGSICDNVNKSTVFQCYDPSQMISQLNALFINHIRYIKNDTPLNDLDKADLIEESTYLILDTLSGIGLLGDIYRDYRIFEATKQKNTK